MGEIGKAAESLKSVWVHAHAEFSKRVKQERFIIAYSQGNPNTFFKLDNSGYPIGIRLRPDNDVAEKGMEDYSSAAFAKICNSLTNSQCYCAVDAAPTDNALFTITARPAPESRAELRV